MSERVLIIVAHSDDESLGMGGTIVRHILDGDNVFAIALTNGVEARNKIEKNDIKLRKKASEEASLVLGFKWLNTKLFPDNKMDIVPILEVVKEVEIIKEKINPTIVYTHSYSDLNIDHQIVNRSVMTAFRPQPQEIFKEIRTFEIPSSTDYGHQKLAGIFSPNLYINITKTWHLKEKALNCYSQEMRDAPHPRSIEGLKNLALLRGNQSGVPLAECFEVLRRIER